VSRCVFSIYLFSALIFFVTACSKSPQAINEQAIIRFGISSAPVTLNPLYATDATSMRINRLLYQRLVEFSPDHSPIAGIAQWQKITAQHYRFSLINSPVFSNNQPVTAHDVKATYDTLLDKQTASPHRNSLKHIKQIDVISDSIIDFHLSRPDPLFPAFLIIDILPKSLLEAEHPFAQHPVGSGAFELVQWPHEGKLLLKRKKDQQLIEFLKVKDPTLRVLKLIQGELDLIQNNLPPEHIRYLKELDSIHYRVEKGANYSYLGFNLTDASVGQVKIRQAIAYALDRNAIIRYALGNAAQKANGFFRAEHWAGASLKGYAFDRQKATQLMNQLGYNENKRLSLSYKTSSDPFRIRIAAIIQSQLKKVFIDINIQSYDWGTFYADIKSGKFQLYSLTWVGINTPDIFRYVFHSQSLPPAGANRGRLIDSRIDKMIQKAEQADSIEQQAALYRQLQLQLNQILPYVSLWYEDNIVFFNKNIQAYQVSPNGNYDALSETVKSSKEIL